MVFQRPDFGQLPKAQLVYGGGGVLHARNASTFHEEYVKLPKADEVPYWQGSGDDYDIAETTAIKVKLPSDNSKTVEADGILCTLFDEEALGVLNFERYTTSNYNGKAEFTNYWHKQKVCQFLDLNENIVVFLCNDETGA